jgi:hypothetical protein
MDRNISTSRQTIQVTVASSSGSGDSEIFTLLETEHPTGSGIYNTGIFTGCVNGSNSSGAGNNNGTLYATDGSNLTATFSDLVNAPDVCTANALILTPGVTASTVTNTLVAPPDAIAVPGDSVIWKIVVSNPGNTPLTTVELTDTWNQSCLTYAGASPPPVSILPAGTITWDTQALGGAIPSGTNRIIYVRFLAVSPCGSITNSATVSGTAPSGPATSEVMIINPQLSIVKTRISPATSTPIYTGTALVYQIHLTNTGSTAIESLPLSDYYSASNLNFISATPAPGSFGGGQIEWADLLPDNNTLAVGASIDVTVTFTAINGNYPFPVSNNATTGFAALDVNNKPIPSVTGGVDVMVLNIPVAVADEFTMKGNAAGSNNILHGQVTRNDISPDGLPLTVNSTPVTPPGHALSFTLHANGSFSYQPTDGFTGDDTFIYQICDSNGYCVTAVVTIHVLPCNNPPDRPGNIIKSQP